MSTNKPIITLNNTMRSSSNMGAGLLRGDGQQITHSSAIHSFVRSFISLRNVFKFRLFGFCVRERKVNDYCPHAMAPLPQSKCNKQMNTDHASPFNRVSHFVELIIILTVNLISTNPQHGINACQLNWIPTWPIKSFCATLNIRDPLTHPRTSFFIMSLIRYVLILWYLTFVRCKTTIYFIIRLPRIS